MRDFGTKTVKANCQPPITLTAPCVAPNLTLHDLVVLFEKGKAEAGPGDAVAGDPARWPVSRGITAVVDAINQAYDAARD